MPIESVVMAAGRGVEFEPWPRDHEGGGGGEGEALKLER